MESSSLGIQSIAVNRPIGSNGADHSSPCQAARFDGGKDRSELPVRSRAGCWARAPQPNLESPILTELPHHVQSSNGPTSRVTRPVKFGYAEQHVTQPGGKTVRNRDFCGLFGP